MGQPKRYVWRFIVEDSEATLEVWHEDYDAACALMRDAALGLAARLQEWAQSEAGFLCQVAAGGEPPNLWENEAAARAWDERRQALLSERGGIQCPDCHEWSDSQANYCGHCAAPLRCWCVACKERLPNHRRKWGER